MSRRILLLAVACVVGISTASSVWAQGITVTVERPVVTLREQIVLQVMVEGATDAVPRLPNDLNENFQVYQRGTQTSINMVNGRRSVSLTHNYLLAPRRVGVFTIGGATVEIGGRTYRSEPFQVRVQEASARPPRDRDAIFIDVEVSTKTPYVGQQVLYTWRFYRRVQVADAQLRAMPFEGFLVEDLGEVREYRTVRGGQQFLVSEIRKALFPQEAGEIIIEPSLLDCQVVVGRRSFFDNRTESRTVASDPIELEVRPRPAAPAGFSGLVGSFRVRSTLAKRELRVGESATWKLDVRGTGNVQMIAEPPLPEMPRFKIYDDKPTSKIERTGAELTGARTFSKALVPLEAGELRVPAVRLVYFDPESGTYQTAATDEVMLDVQPGEGQEDLRLTESRAPGGGKVQVRILADDILPIHKGSTVAAAPFGHRATPSWLGAVLAPPLLYLGLVVFESRRRKLAGDIGLRRRLGALGRAQKVAAEISSAAAGDAVAAAQHASRCLREYIGDKTNLEGAALTPSEAAEQLAARGVEAELVEDVRRRLETFEAAQYGGAASLDPATLGGEIAALIQSLDKQLR